MNAPDTSPQRAKPGHVRITNVTLERGDGFADIGFDIEWQGSWRHDGDRRSGNWDAAWVFIKYQTQERKVVAATPEVRSGLDHGSLDGLLEAARAAWPDGPGPRSLPTRASVIRSLKDAIGSPPPSLPSPPSGPPAWLRGLLDVKPVQPGAWVIRQENRLGGGAPSNDETSVEYIRAKVLAPAAGKESEAEPQIELSKPSGWKHATLSSVTRAPETATVTLSDDGLGVFIHRSGKALGEGPARFERVVVRCDPGTQAADFAGNVSLWVLGVEMVLVPEGPFSAGDPAGPSGPHACFYDADKGESDKDRSYLVTSEDPIAVGSEGSGSRLFYDDGSSIGNQGDGKGPVPTAFPKGFGAFYMMKYQITQAQYGDFVNTLAGHARTVRFSYWYGDYRYSIYMTQSGQRVTLRPDRACNWLSWMDGAAFACWAGLRPATELEFEKVCRGPLPAVAGEYAWGTANLKQAQVIFGDEAGHATVTGNCAYGNFRLVGGDGGAGPLPGHVFGAADEHGAFELTQEGRASFSIDGDDADVVPVDLRERRGDSYYGVLGLSGNLWEWCVTVGNATGRRFTGTHGTGALDGFGNPDTAALGWPALDTEGACVRGGSWYTGSDQLRLADRSYGSGLAGYSTRSHDFGYRCARTAPSGGERPARVDPRGST